MFRLSSAPPEGRLWIRNESRDRLIQVQNGRLHYNWVAQSGSDYPRYHRVRPEFIETLRAFRAFLHEELDQAVIANQWEVTYVNRLPRGTVWSTPEDWVRLFPGQAGIPTTLPTLALESFGSSWHYEIPPRQGRLHVEIQHRLQDGGDPVLIMKLTARGHASGPGESGISAEEGLELGHEAIVRTFFAMTSPEAHNYWGMCQ